VRATTFQRKKVKRPVEWLLRPRKNNHSSKLWALGSPDDDFDNHKLPAGTPKVLFYF